MKVSKVGTCDMLAKTLQYLESMQSANACPACAVSAEAGKVACHNCGRFLR